LAHRVSQIFALIFFVTVIINSIIVIVVVVVVIVVGIAVVVVFVAVVVTAVVAIGVMTVTDIVVVDRLFEISVAGGCPPYPSFASGKSTSIERNNTCSGVSWIIIRVFHTTSGAMPWL
jgi:hypothetical protein